MAKKNNTKKKSKQPKSNTQSRPKVPGGGWTSGINTSSVSQSTETNIDDILSSIDDEGVKEITDEFQRLLDDEPLALRMKQVVKFPDQFVENMETLLNNKAFNTLQPLFRILRAWKENISSNKKCQDIFSVGIGCASAFSHMVGELSMDAMHTAKQNHVEGVKSAPSPEEMKLVSLIASPALNDRINKSSKNIRYRLTLENDTDRLVNIMGHTYPNYKAEYDSQMVVDNDFAQDLLGNRVDDKNDSSEGVEESKQSAESQDQVVSAVIYTSADDSDDDNDKCTYQLIFLKDPEQFVLQCPQYDVDDWIHHDYKALHWFMKKAYYNAAKLLEGIQTEEEEFGGIPTIEDYKDSERIAFPQWIGKLINDYSGTFAIKAQELALYVIDKNIYDDTKEPSTFEDFDILRSQIHYESWLRILLSRLLWVNDRLFWKDSYSDRLWMTIPHEAVKKSKKDKTPKSKKGSKDASRATSAQASPTTEIQRGGQEAIKLERWYSDCKEKNAKYTGKTKALCQGLLKNNLQGTQQVDASTPAYQYVNYVGDFYSEVYDLRENSAADATSYMFPFGSSSLMKTIAWDWSLAKMMDKYISKLDVSSQNKIWNLMSTNAKEWIAEKMHWSVMTITLGLCPHAIFRFLAIHEAGFEMDLDELARIYIEQVAVFPADKVMKILSNKMTNKKVSVPSVEWRTHIMNVKRQASDFGVILTDVQMLEAVFMLTPALRIIQSETGQINQGAMLESCEENVSAILKMTKFTQISVVTPLPNPEQATLKSVVKWYKSRLDDGQIDEKLASKFFEIIKRVESCVMEDGSGLLEEDKRAAEDDPDDEEDQVAPKSAMRAGAQKNGKDKVLTLDIKKKDKSPISPQELRENKVGAKEFYKICKQLSDEIKEVVPSPCFYCMIGNCNKSDHTLTEIKQIHIYILLAIVRNKVDEKATIFANKPVKTGDFTLEKVMALVYGADNKEESEGSSKKSERDPKKTGERVETIEAVKANGYTYRLPVFALQKIAQNMAGACSPWINHNNDELEKCTHCNGMHPKGFKINNTPSCPCGSYNPKSKMFYKHCQGSDTTCLTYLALSHPEGQKAFLDEGVSRADLEVLLNDHDFNLTREAKNHTPRKPTSNRPSKAANQNLTPQQRKANRMALSGMGSDSTSTSSSSRLGVPSDASTQSWGSTSTFGRNSFLGGRGGRGGNQSARGRGAPGSPWSDTVHSGQSISTQSDSQSQLSDSSQYTIEDETIMLVNRLGRHERDNNTEGFQADARRLRALFPHIVGEPLHDGPNSTN